MSLQHLEPVRFTNHNCRGNATAHKVENIFSIIFVKSEAKGVAAAI